LDPSGAHHGRTVASLLGAAETQQQRHQPWGSQAAGEGTCGQPHADACLLRAMPRMQWPRLAMFVLGLGQQSVSDRRMADCVLLGAALSRKPNVARLALKDVCRAQRNPLVAPFCGGSDAIVGVRLRWNRVWVGREQSQQHA